MLKRAETRHYSEEELLMHFLQEESAAAAQEITSHLGECDECLAIFKDYGDVVGRIRAWTVQDVPDTVRRAQKSALLAQYARDFAEGRGRGWLSSLVRSLQSGWNYALEHPLPALGFVAAVITFAMEQTISTFRLERILPGASEVFQVLKQIF